MNSHAKSSPVYVTKNDSIDNVKAKIQEKEGNKACRIIYQDTGLEGERLLFSYGIKEGEILRVDKYKNHRTHKDPGTRQRWLNKKRVEEERLRDEWTAMSPEERLTLYTQYSEDEEEEAEKEKEEDNEEKEGENQDLDKPEKVILLMQILFQMSKQFMNSRLPTSLPIVLDEVIILVNHLLRLIRRMLGTFVKILILEICSLELVKCITIE